LRGLGLWTQYQNVQIHERKLKGLIEAADVKREEKPWMPRITGAFQFHSLGLRYSDEDPFLFRKVNLKVKAGEIIAIRGADGSGRSSMLQVLSGTRQPTEGYVSFDGMKAADYSERSLREQIAYLPEKGVLFKGTVLDNITMFGGDELIDPAIELAGAVGLDREFARLPKGYDTVVGDSSVEYLPSGVIQRIAVVRALVRQPRLILFDEANSGLDFRSDNELRDLLASLGGKSTIVLVSHRPSMIRLADRVFDLKDRKFTEAKDLQAPPAQSAPTRQAAS
jgi:ATP-binding cassette subfamily C protein LapB